MQSLALFHLSNPIQYEKNLLVIYKIWIIKKQLNEGVHICCFRGSSHSQSTKTKCEMLQIGLQCENMLYLKNIYRNRNNLMKLCDFIFYINVIFLSIKYYEKCKDYHPEVTDHARVKQHMHHLCSIN